MNKVFIAKIHYHYDYTENISVHATYTGALKACAKNALGDKIPESPITCLEQLNETATSSISYLIESFEVQTP